MNMDFGKLVNSSFDPGSVLKEELEQGLQPITERVDRLEKKLDSLLVTMRSIDESLKRLKPVFDTILKLPIFRK